MPPPENPSLPLPQAHGLLASFGDFLTVAVHALLFHRGLYPPETFLAARAYNLAVRQNRHPRVVAWVRDAVDAVAAQLAGGAVRHVAFVVHAPPRPPPPPDLPAAPGSDSDVSSAPAPPAPEPAAVLERWLFDVSRFPAWPGGADTMRLFAKTLRKAADDEPDDEPGPAAADDPDGDPAAPPPPADAVNWADLDEQLRGLLRRLMSAAERLGALPEGCTFTVAVELRDEAEAPTRVRSRPVAVTPLNRPADAGPLTPAPWVASPAVDPLAAEPPARLRTSPSKREGRPRRRHDAHTLRGGRPALSRVLGRGGQGEGGLAELHSAQPRNVSGNTLNPLVYCPRPAILLSARSSPFDTQASVLSCRPPLYIVQFQDTGRSGGLGAVIIPFDAYKYSVSLFQPRAVPLPFQVVRPQTSVTSLLSAPAHANMPLAVSALQQRAEAHHLPPQPGVLLLDPRRLLALLLEPAHQLLLVLAPLALERPHHLAQLDVESLVQQLVLRRRLLVQLVDRLHLGLARPQARVHVPLDGRLLFRELCYHLRNALLERLDARRELADVARGRPRQVAVDLGHLVGDARELRLERRVHLVDGLLLVLQPLAELLRGLEAQLLRRGLCRA